MLSEMTFVFFSLMVKQNSLQAREWRLTGCWPLSSVFDVKAVSSAIHPLTDES